MTFFGRFSAVSARRGVDRGGCEADAGRWAQTADGCTVRSVSAGAETGRNGPIISEFWPFLTRVSRPAGDLVGPGRWAPTTRAEDPRTLAYLVDTPKGR